VNRTGGIPTRWQTGFGCPGSRHIGNWRNRRAPRHSRTLAHDPGKDRAQVLAGNRLDAGQSALASKVAFSERQNVQVKKR